jgi:hypothetical protein
MHNLAFVQSGGERIAELLHEANENWVRMQDDDGWLPQRLSGGNISCTEPYYLYIQRGARVQDSRLNMIHCLRIRNRPTGGHPRRDINNTKLLVAARVSQQFLARTSNIMMMIIRYYL